MLPCWWLCCCCFCFIFLLLLYSRFVYVCNISSVCIVQCGALRRARQHSVYSCCWCCCCSLATHICLCLSFSLSIRLVFGTALQTITLTFASWACISYKKALFIARSGALEVDWNNLNKDIVDIGIISFYSIWF